MNAEIAIAMAASGLPPSLITKDLLKKLSSSPNLPLNSWYFIVGSTLSTLNRPDETAKVLQFAIERATIRRSDEKHQESAHQIARKTREAMIKLTAIAGLPKTINSLLALKAVTPSHLQDEPLSQSPTLRAIHIHDVPPARILHEGQRFFDSIYGKVSKRVMGQMDRSGTEDLGIVARLIYGYVLSNTSILTAAETSYVLLAGLIPQDDNSDLLIQVNPQLKGHLRGALNNGATKDEVQAVRHLIMTICDMYGMRRLRATDLENRGWYADVADL